MLVEEGFIIGASKLLGGTPAAKLGGREIKDHLAKKFGKDWSKRLLPKDVEVLNDQVIGHVLQVGTSAGLKSMLVAPADDARNN